MIMQHLDILYVFFALLFGLVSLGTMGLSYYRYREELAIYALLAQGTFSWLVLSRLLISYLGTNMPYLEESFLIWFRYQEAFLALYSFLLAMLLFTHCIADHPAKRRLNLIMGLLVLVMFVLQHFTEFSGRDATDHLGDYIERCFMVAIMIYSLVMLRVRLPRIGDPDQRLLAGRFFLLSLFFLPGTVVDLFVEELAFRFFPLFSMVTATLFTLHFLKRPLPQGEIKVPVAAETIPETLSNRERQVFDLLLQGKSNLDIGKALFISLSTVKTHVANIFQKCEVRSRYELLARYAGRGPDED